MKNAILFRELMLYVQYFKNIIYIEEWLEERMHCTNIYAMFSGGIQIYFPSKIRICIMLLFEF